MKRGWRKFARSEKGQENSRRTSKAKRLKFPEKAQARLIADRAQRAGTLIPEPCSECGEVNVEKHHPDYSQPLKIMWLCRVHHKSLHKAENLTRV